MATVESKLPIRRSCRGEAGLIFRVAGPAGSKVVGKDRRLTRRMLVGMIEIPGKFADSAGVMMWVFMSWISPATL